jgi:hypothetical protein
LADKVNHLRPEYLKLEFRANILKLFLRQKVITALSEKISQQANISLTFDDGFQPKRQIHTI